VTALPECTPYYHLLGVGPAGLTPEQDAHLRRLHYFEQIGADLAPEFQDLLSRLKHAYRRGDRRRFIRAPDDDVLLLSDAP
jgi:hypothetical protein